MSNFSHKLKSLRIERGITQKKLADSLNVSQNAIYNWENGKREPSIEMIKKIATVLGITIAEFLDDDFFDAATLPDAEYEETLIDDKFKSIIENDNLNRKEKETMIRNLISQVEIVENLHKEHAEIARQYLLDGLFNKLNSDGKDKAIEQVELLTKIHEYCKEEPPAE